jgi:hypothetical protein
MSEFSVREQWNSLHTLVSPLVLRALLLDPLEATVVTEDDLKRSVRSYIATYEMS